MKLSSARRLGALVSLGVVAALAPAVTLQASAETGTINHSCTVDSNPVSGVKINQNTTAPASSPAGTPIKPNYFVVLTLPASFMDELREQGGQFVKRLGGTFTANMTTNGKSTPVVTTFPSTPIPTQMGTSLKLTGSGPMAQVTPGGPGTITYAPGTVGLNIKFQGSDGGTLATRTGSCAKPLNPPNVDVVNITAATVKAPSRIGTGVVYKPGTKKLTVAGKVFANPDQVVTGNMNFKLFKAGKVIRNVTSALSQSVAKRTFGGTIGKGTYYVKFTYYGSPKVKAATATRKVVIR